jgi:hydrogenase expression/formation protein HypE
VRGFSSILGLDPLYMGNEGKMAALVPQRDAEKALAVIRASRYGQDAQVIGIVRKDKEALVTIRTLSGATRIVEPLAGEGLPRIC